jgi:hypothetical protein
MFLNDITYSTILCSDGVLLNFDTLYSTGINPTIDPATIYLIEFTEELTIPSGNSVSISPSGYTLKNASNFTPQCFAKIASEYTDGSQTVIKLTVKDTNYKVLKTQYKRIICSSQSSKPCIVPIDHPAKPQYITLNIKNNWEYIYNGYIIAKFVPTDITNGIKIRLPRKDISYLPSRGQNDQIKISISLDKLQEYKLTAEGIKALLGGNTVYTVKKREVFFIFDSLDRTIPQIENLQVSSVPVANSTNTLPVTIKNLGTVTFNTSKPSPIPTVSLVRWTNSEVTTFLGELILNPDTYQVNDEIIVIYNSNTITGTINNPLLLLTS